MAWRSSHPVSDLSAYLEGPWHLRRVAWDAGLRRFVRLTGTAAFTPDADCLFFEEQGTMTTGAFRGETSQRYRFAALRNGRCEVRFADGRPFHPLDLSQGQDEVRHHCAPDLYRGRYRVLGPDSWTLAWRITGPRKDLALASRFTRG